jgi:hypothetical protein
LKLEELVKMLDEEGKAEFTGLCCDCNFETTVKAEVVEDRIEISGGAVFRPPEGWHCPTEFMVKCPVCFKIDSRFYPATEVYSRVVGMPGNDKDQTRA